MRFTTLVTLALFLLLSMTPSWAQDAPSAEAARSWGSILADLGTTGVLGLGLYFLAKHHSKKLTDWEEERKAWQQERDALKQGYVAGKDQLRTELRREIIDLRERLAQSEREHREHVEKLHAENKEIMREVLVTCNAVSQALENHAKAMEGWTEAPEE